jgi:hypothetical protein
METIKVIELYITAINDHDVERMLNLMHPEHTLVDSSGNIVQGSTDLRSAWANYFNMIPDYEITVDEVILEYRKAAIFGVASGYYHNKFWQTYAAWRVLIRDGKIILWQVYADNEQLRILFRQNDNTNT